VRCDIPKPEFEFFDPLSAGDSQWMPVAGSEGLYEQILSMDSSSGDYTRLLRFEPGASTAAQGTLVHDFWEEVWIVEGAFRDIRLNQTFSKGMYACRPPGMPHGPWVSDQGILTFEIRYGMKQV
jgi:hypothetical protein